MASVHDFVGEFRRLLVSSSSRSERLRETVSREPTAGNFGFDAKYAVKFSEQVLSKTEKLLAQTSELASICSKAPTCEELYRQLEETMSETDGDIARLEATIAEYGYEAPKVPPQSEALPETADDDRAADPDGTGPRDANFATPHKSTRSDQRRQDIPPKTPTLADYGISFDEVENLVSKPPARTPVSVPVAVLPVGPGAATPSPDDRNDPDYLPEVDADGQRDDDDTSSWRTPTQIKTALHFTEDDIDDLVPEDRYYKLVSSFARSRAPVATLRTAVSRLRHQFGSKTTAAFVAQSELEEHLGVPAESVKAVALALTQLKLLAIKRNQDQIGYLWCGGFPVSA